MVGSLRSSSISKPYRRRKAALRQQAAAAGPEARTIFAADKVSKVRELRSAIVTAARRQEPVEESLLAPRRLAHLRHCPGTLQKRLGDSPLAEQLMRAELVGLNNDLKAYSEIKALA